MMRYFDDQLTEIGEALHSMDEKIFRQMVSDAVETIRAGHKVIATGLGKNVPICDKFVGSMVSLGLDAAFLHTNSAVHGDMGMVKDGDMVIMLTKSGETSESKYLAGLLKDRDIRMWLLTFCRDSTLTREIPNSLVLDLRDEGDMWNIMPNNSSTLNLIVLQGLAMMAAKEMNIELGQFKRNHPGGHIGELLR